MAAIFGILQPSGDPWEASDLALKKAGEAMASRCPGEPVALRQKGLIARYSSKNEGGYHRDDALVVLLDGYVDNLGALDEAGLSSGEEAWGPARRIARIYRERGLEALFAMLGCFGLVLIDLSAGRAHLIRDRFGLKPLFYTRAGSGWAFASEAKMLLPLLAERRLNEDALSEVFHYRFLAGNDALVAGVHQGMAATCVSLAPGEAAREQITWALTLAPTPARGTLDPWVDRLDEALLSYFKTLPARFPRVGVPLSGGVDSSLLAALARKTGFEHVVAVTARWPDHPNPELENAREIALHLGVPHVIVDIDEGRLHDALPEVIWRLEQPPRHFFSLILGQLFDAIAGDVDGMLYGEGADGFFGPGGFHFLSSFERRRGMVEKLPAPLLHGLSRLPKMVSQGRLRRIRDYLSTPLRQYMLSLLEIESDTSPAEIARGVARSPALSPTALLRFCPEGESPFELFQKIDQFTIALSHREIFDRLLSPHEVELIIPFIESSVVAIAKDLPREFKLFQGETKPVIKRVACRYLPHDFVYRSKLGFPTPTTAWLAGPLRRWVEYFRDTSDRYPSVVDMRRLAALDVEKDHELIWTALCLEMYARQLHGDDPRVRV